MYGCWRHAKRAFRHRETGLISKVPGAGRKNSYILFYVVSRNFDRLEHANAVYINRADAKSRANGRGIVRMYLNPESGSDNSLLGREHDQTEVRVGPYDGGHWLYSARSGRAAGRIVWPTNRQRRNDVLGQCAQSIFCTTFFKSCIKINADLYPFRHKRVDRVVGLCREYRSVVFRTVVTA